jgi:glycosyltransferase involved in cell wall biosynthesis
VRRLDGDFRILIVGRMTKAEYYEGFRDATDLYKGFKQLILATGLLARAVPEARLTIVGDGDARPELETWAMSRPERAHLEFLGRVSDERLRQLYAQADVFALPSEGEGFGLVFVEAMAQGVPCVCVNAGAAPEVVRDGETGLVARPRDVADLADKLFVLARNPALRARLGENARRVFAETFTAEAFERRIIAALEAAMPR